MKVLIVAKRLSNAGTSRVLSLLSQQWVTEGHIIDLFLMHPYANAFPVGGTIKKNGILFNKLHSSKVLHLSVFLLKNPQYDQILGFSEDANYPLIQAAKLIGQAHKTVLSVHISKINTNNKRRIKRFYPWAHSVIAVSNGVKQGLEQLGLHNVRVAHNPINYSKIHLLSEIAPSIIMEADIFNIVAVGRLHHDKGYDLLIHSLALLINKMKLPKPVHLHIIGEGNQDPLLKLAQQLDVSHLITFHGQMENPFALMLLADAFILSSRNEGFPLVLIEAMSLGMPVISFNCPHGPKELIQHNKNGLLVPPLNVDQLAKSIQFYIDNPVHAISLGKAGQSTVYPKLDITEIAPQWLVL